MIKEGFKNRLKSFMITDEGIEKKAYKCTAGKISIAIGRNIEDLGLSEDEIDYLFENDVDRVIGELSTVFENLYEMDEKVFFVLFSMCFNLGLPRFLEFKKTIQYVKDGEYKKAAIEMLDSRWAGQVKDRAKRLSNIMYNA